MSVDDLKKLLEGGTSVLLGPLDGNNIQTGDLLKVPDIQCSDIEAQMQSSGPDHKILDGDGDAFGGLLALDASGKLGDGK